MPQNTPQKPTTGGKPTLLATPSLTSERAHPKDDWADSRILSDSKMGPLVGQKNKKKPLAPAAAPSSGVWLKLLLALGGIAVVAFVGYQYLMDTHQAPALASAHAPAVVLTPPAEPMQVAQVTPEPVQAQPAQIIEEPTPTAPSAPAAAPSPASLTATLEAGVKPQPAALEKALQATSDPDPKKKPAAEKPALPAPPAPAKVAAAAKVAPIAAVASVAVAAAPKAPTPAAAPLSPAATAVASEKDVSLLAALVAHNNTTAAKPGADAAPSETARPAEESAEALLRRCATLEADRQAACRAKVCTGARANEAVCKPAAPVASPAPPAPSANTPASAPPALPTALPTLPTLPALPTSQ